MIPSSSQILLPVRMGTIIGSFAAALFLNFLPWKDLRLVPDFVALVLTFWCVRQPRLVGLGVAWTIGLLVDAGNGVLLGQHALAYSLLAFFRFCSCAAFRCSGRSLTWGTGASFL